MDRFARSLIDLVNMVDALAAQGHVRGSSILMDGATIAQ